MNKITLAAVLTTALLASAASAATPAQKGFITGTVVNEKGQPLPGVEIDVDNTLSYDSSLVTYTDAQGRYKVDVRKLPFTFQVYAKLKIKYGNTAVKVELVPNNPDAVAGVAGGVRDFVLKPKPVTSEDPYGNLACVFVERGIGEYDVDTAQVQVTLTPVGKLADGSAGTARTFKLLPSGSGPVIPNIMWGTYKVTATLNGKPLEIRRRTSPNTFQWSTSFTGGFVRDYNINQPNMYLEVRLPGSGN
ncbi:carboxypeptidase-like regulatory domain-containing protein [Deinococcus ficus]|uniref:carboxypeptidase-like regulatory domain-containing protein n=1 Tax=Deinococcus ficus TaxID=317577 RepID=UPI0003B2EEA5|nr:carboxypeptidase-like regulatory domain-containing protein [Deinococcus ficus]